MTGYCDELPTTKPTTARVRPDVYAYVNASKAAALCISCAVDRRARGARVELVGGGRVVRRECEDCNEQNK
jgi:hypothetical protein